MKSEGELMSGFETAEFLVKIARFLRELKTFGGHKLVGRIRRRASCGFFHLLHMDVVHRLRQLGMCMESGNPDQHRASELAIEFCTACALLMQQIVEVEQQELHCCLKVIVKGQNGKGDKLLTWARSNPQDDREDSEEGSPLIENTSWNAFAGSNDGKNHWRRMCCFCCNDLTDFTDEFDNGRKEWSKFYKSKLTFPIRYLDKSKANTWETIGFLEFDSMKRKVFTGMPSSFEHIKDPSGFRAKLEKNAIFHSGAIIADSLSMCLRPYYESRKNNTKI
jgi:hypothetical protein